MQEPSKKWRRTRQAALERATRHSVEPLEPQFSIYGALCVYYLAGFVWLSFIADTASYSVLDAFKIVSFGVAGLLVPILTGSVLTLSFTKRRLQAMAER